MQCYCTGRYNQELQWTMIWYWTILSWNTIRSGMVLNNVIWYYHEKWFCTVQCYIVFPWQVILYWTLNIVILYNHEKWYCTVQCYLVLQWEVVWYSTIKSSIQGSNIPETSRICTGPVVNWNEHLYGIENMVEYWTIQFTIPDSFAHSSAKKRHMCFTLVDTSMMVTSVYFLSKLHCNTAHIVSSRHLEHFRILISFFQIVSGLQLKKIILIVIKPYMYVNTIYNYFCDVKNYLNCLPP